MSKTQGPDTEEGGNPALSKKKMGEMLANGKKKKESGGIRDGGKTENTWKSTRW